MVGTLRKRLFVYRIVFCSDARALSSGANTYGLKPCKVTRASERYLHESCDRPGGSGRSITRSMNAPSTIIPNSSQRHFPSSGFVASTKAQAAKYGRKLIIHTCKKGAI